MIEIRNVAVGMKQAVALVGMRMVRAARVGILVFVILAIALSTGSCKHEPSSVASGTTNNAQGGALSSGSGSAHVNYKANVHLVPSKSSVSDSPSRLLFVIQYLT